MGTDGGPGGRSDLDRGYSWPVTEADGRPLDQRLEEIGAQLAWVRDYL